MQRPLSAETRVVFRSADASADPDEVAELARAVEDWRRVIWLAEKEVATSALHRMLGRSPENHAPPAVMAYLSKSAMVSDFRMRHLADRLGRTSRSLAEHGVPFVLLKGAAVGALTDPTFCARPMTDLDLLIHPADADRARKAIIASGWPETTNPILLKLLQDQHHLPPFVDPQMPDVRLELHVSLLPADHSFGFDASDIWRDAQDAPGPFAGALVPSREMVVLHACAHFAWQHTMLFGAWRTVRTVNAMLKHPDFDWSGFVHRAQTAKAATACYWTLRLANRLGGLVVPTDALARLAPPNAPWINDAIERHFVAALAPGEGPTCPSAGLSRLLWRAALRPRWSGHGQVGRWDPEHRWEREHGTLSTETATARVVRHLANVKDWWRFFFTTLVA